MEKAIILAVWASYLALQAIYDGKMWYLARKDERTVESLKTHPHVISITSRIMVALLLSLLLRLIEHETFWQQIKSVIGLGAMLPLIFDGVYYETRKRIDAPKGYWFFGQSTTSTGTIDFKPVMRIVLFIIGILFYFFHEHIDISWGGF